MLREFDTILCIKGLSFGDRLQLWGRRLVSGKSVDAIPPLESGKMNYPNVHRDEVWEGTYSFQHDLGTLVQLVRALKERRARGEIVFDYGAAHVYHGYDRVRMTDCVSVFVRPKR